MRRHETSGGEWTVGEFRLPSRLMLGSGRFPDLSVMRRAVEASGAGVVTVALRRLPLDPETGRIEEGRDPTACFPAGVRVLPNTAGCARAAEAVSTARLAREMGMPSWIKLEVIPDPAYLMPDPVGTLEAARTLIKEGFTVLPYIHADPILALLLEKAGCAAVMPLASPIGSGQGLTDLQSIRIIVEKVSVPVVVDAGIGAPSDAALAMEIGASACLVNTAIARAKDPVGMARAFRLGVEAGRLAGLSGRISKREAAMPSSPTAGVPKLAPARAA